jgi:type IV pilus assembly protein PilB
MLVEALRRGASDIHIEPYEKELHIRFRIDGMLFDVMHPPLKLRDALIARIKIMARLDISEKRLPQDGRLRLKVTVDGRHRDLEFRVSTFPTISGESTVMRLIDKNTLVNLQQLGLDQSDLEKFKRNITKQAGMVLVTGPTGSGKTNTIYSAMFDLKDPTVKIMTAEDPVEYVVPGLNQAQVRDALGCTYASALRSFRRQDANVVRVGALRDFETIDLAIKAALTGHLVLTTLHTNDAPSTIDRLINAGAEPLLLATALNLILAQRLVRRICGKCKVEVQMPAKALLGAGFSPEEAQLIKMFKGAGCSTCNNTGYKGRIGLFEVLEINEPTREMIRAGISGPGFREKVIAEGMTTLRESGLEKIRQGLTTLEEVLRETKK